MGFKLTPSQKKIYDYIKVYTLENSGAPSIRNIASYTGLSISTVSEHVKNMVRKGALRQEPGKSRSLEVVDLSFPETTNLFICAINELEISINPVTKESNEKAIATLKAAAKILGLDLYGEEGE